jgi:hypothetical protein
MLTDWTTVTVIVVGVWAVTSDADLRFARAAGDVGTFEINGKRASGLGAGAAAGRRRTLCSLSGKALVRIRAASSLCSLPSSPNSERDGGCE